MRRHEFKTRDGGKVTLDLTQIEGVSLQRWSDGYVTYIHTKTGCLWQLANEHDYEGTKRLWEGA